MKTIMEIEGFPRYLIYPDSRIWSKKGKGKFLKHNVNPGGYHRVGPWRDGKQKMFLVHRLVAQTFIPNPDNKPEVDHINNNTHDNRLENLRWVTSLENSENKGKNKSNTSGHKNIRYHKESARWEFIKVINKKSYSKRFGTKIEALCYKFCFLLLNQQRKRLACGVRR
tara:strand:- start:125 stop:628 length:504 start_codon:yes stop_codon:yes gene_type:complete